MGKASFGEQAGETRRRQSGRGPGKKGNGGGSPRRDRAIAGSPVKLISEVCRLTYRLGHGYGGAVQHRRTIVETVLR